MIFITGDTHGTFDLIETVEYFKNKRNITKSDFLIILGDVGVCWHGNYKDKEVIIALHELPCTVLFVDGNHENFDILDNYPVSDWNGGKVQFITDDIIHLMRGEIFEIEGHIFFAFGGAMSTDKNGRNDGDYWWSRELPDQDEINNAIGNLDRYNNKVNYILSHTAPRSIVRKLDRKAETDRLQDFFETLLSKVQFDKWFFGHWHKNKTIDSKFHACFLHVIKI